MEPAAATTHFFRRLRWSVAALEFGFLVRVEGLYLQGKTRKNAKHEHVRVCVGEEVKHVCVRCRDQRADQSFALLF